MSRKWRSVGGPAAAVACSTGKARRSLGVTVVVTAAAIFVVAPQVLPPGYSVLQHSISESAAQATEGAWLARAGLALFGIGTLLLIDVVCDGRRWAKAGLGVFGFGLVGAAVWSHAPWLAHVPNDKTEDLLHSIASSVVGMGFIGATLAVVWFARDRFELVTSLGALSVSLVVPLLMALDRSRAGVWQRLMFGVAMMWLVVSWWRARSAPVV